jgi:hypothetical protein
MKKHLLLLALLTLSALHAENIQMTPEQEKIWEIKVETPQSSKRLPLGEFITEVVTPPSLLHIISLPFEANVKKLNVGSVLAEVTGTEWIAIQQKAIADAIEFRHHTHLTERKNMLCKEEIIPQKECVAANAELEADKIKVAASKALLQSYGASDETIATLFKELKLSQTMEIKSSVDGHIVELHAIPGKSTSPSDALFIIQQEGSKTSILQISPVINPENQTRQIRFSVPADINIFSGLRSSANFTILGESLKVQKTSVIKEGGTQIVFIKTKEGFTAVPVKVLAEDNTHYFIKASDRLRNKIAVNSIAILKNMLGDNDE